MSELFQPARPEDGTGVNRKVIAAVRCLADTLDGFARMYSEDYDDGVEDGIKVSCGTTELGGSLTSSIGFEARRLRGSSAINPLSLSEVQICEYTIESMIRCEDIPYATLPREVYEYIDQFEDMNTNDYNKDSHVALEYEQKFTVTSDGELLLDSSICIYIEGDGVSLPADPLDLMPQDGDDTETSGLYGDPLLRDVFSAEEMRTFELLTDEIMEEHVFNHPVYRFYELAEGTRPISTRDQIKAAENIVRSLFSLKPES